jgi:hypothetical protein
MTVLYASRSAVNKAGTRDFMLWHWQRRNMYYPPKLLLPRKSLPCQFSPSLLLGYATECLVWYSAIDNSVPVRGSIEDVMAPSRFRWLARERGDSTRSNLLVIIFSHSHLHLPFLELDGKP